ncbi:hypothetical protein DW322_18110 [Rhodococcus rhodnii]|uniref:Uncharacterized protein n=3 Tax=Rhodococcus rhodnii TaxID=38312 RepID=R7WPZ2_9NOCA|nr:hypothetical protein Rrhod_1256 [Rhodococcus rhodnii LMG 5362]TXG91751.1 hypothetical protein DW322_18110 [Rhodococcus rhodnii]
MTYRQWNILVPGAYAALCAVQLIGWVRAEHEWYRIVGCVVAVAALGAIVVATIARRRHAPSRVMSESLALALLMGAGATALHTDYAGATVTLIVFTLVLGIGSGSGLFARESPAAWIDRVTGFSPRHSRRDG